MKKFYKNKFCKNTAKPSHRTIEDQFFILGMIIAVAAGAFLFLGRLLPLQLRLPPCWFHLISGYYCPGCGGTRALRALLHGRLLLSAWYHPFVLYAVSIYFYFMATQTIEHLSHGKLPIGMRYHNYIVWTAVALILVNFIIKNLLHYFYGLIL